MMLFIDFFFLFFFIFLYFFFFFFFSSRRRHTRCGRDWSSDVCSSDLFTCYFVQEPVRARRFDITGIYETNFEDYDQLFILTEKIILGNLNERSEERRVGKECRYRWGTYH